MEPAVTGHDAGYAFLVLNVIVMAAISVRASRGIWSPQGFFHEKSLLNNTLSLVAANITVGTGLVYLLSAGQEHGGLMVLVPISSILGYVWLSREVRRAGSSLPAGRDLLSAAQDQLAGSVSLRPVLVCVLTVYTLVLGFELVVAPQIIAPLVTPSPGAWASVVLSVYLFLVALLTVVFGGIRGIFRTDKAQLAGIVFLTAVILLSIIGLSNEARPATRAVFRTDPAVLIALVTACLAAFMTQFLNILNWGIISHLEQSGRSVVLLVAGVVSGSLLLIYVLFGAVASSHGADAQQLLLGSYGTLAEQSTVLSWLVCGLVVYGLASATCSTADSLIMTVAQMAYDGLVGRQSSSTDSSRASLLQLKLTIAATSILCFLAIVLMRQYAGTFFSLLLMLASGAMVFAPFLWLLARLTAAAKLAAVLSRQVVLGFVALFFLTYALVVSANVAGYPGLAQVFSLGALVVSAIASLWLWYKAED